MMDKIWRAGLERMGCKLEDLQPRMNPSGMEMGNLTAIMEVYTCACAHACELCLRARTSVVVAHTDVWSAHTNVVSSCSVFELSGR